MIPYPGVDRQTRKELIAWDEKQRMSALRRQPHNTHWQLVMEQFKNENPQIVPNMHILYKLLREYFSRG